MHNRRNCIVGALVAGFLLTGGHASVGAQEIPTTHACVSSSEGGQVAAASTAVPYRYWPLFPRPRVVITMKPEPTQAMKVVQQTLAGLVALACRKGQLDQMIWTPNDTPYYERWFNMMVKHTSATVQGPFETWELVERYRQAGLVKGYSLYQPDSGHGGYDGPSGPAKRDNSLSVATSLCALTGALPVPPDLEATAREHNLKLVGDARSLTEEQCLDQYGKFFDRSLVAVLHPSLAVMRQECVALQLFVLSGPGPLYNRALREAQPDSPLLGWPHGDEQGVTLPLSRWGVFQTETNLTQNLALLATEVPGVTYSREKLQRSAPPAIWDLPWEDDVHYAAFVMSDGDNVQWMMGSFDMGGGRNRWNSSYRGTLPIGWSLCYPDLAQLSPYTLDYFFSTATPTDDFLVFGGGYYYPDVYGSSRPGQDLLALHAARVGQYMQLGRMNLLLVNMQSWESAAAKKAYATYVREMPGLEAIYTVQYLPYTAGKGKILWIPNAQGGLTPVISLRYAIWAHSGEPGTGGPIKVSRLLNEGAHEGPPAGSEFFSTVMIHCWSWFKNPPLDAAPGADEIDPKHAGNPGTAGGLALERWCMDRLQPWVRVVTPSQLAGLARLRIHPRETLLQELQILEVSAKNRVPASSSQELTAALARIAEARRLVQEGDYHSSFEQGKAAYAMLRR
jgi:hypothetical protein